MSRVINFGYTDTAISGVTSLAFPRGLLNYGADFREVTDSNGELILTNLTCPIDRPENIRMAYSLVQDIYKGTGIDVKVQNPLKRGVSLLAQVTEVATVTDSADPSFRMDLPISAHIVLKVPASADLTDAHVQTIVGRLVSCLYETGSLTTARIKALLRGSLEPTDI